MQQVTIHPKLNMGEFPSGQRGQTVNLLSLTSMVRIHPLPPNKNQPKRVGFLFGQERMFDSEPLVRRRSRNAAIGGADCQSLEHTKAVVNRSERSTARERRVSILSHQKRSNFKSYFFFYPSRRLGISSRFSVYIIAVRRISSPKVHTPAA